MFFEQSRLQKLAPYLGSQQHDPDDYSSKCTDAGALSIDPVLLPIKRKLVF